MCNIKNPSSYIRKHQFFFYYIRKWFSYIRKRFSNIRKWISNITIWFSNISNFKKWFLMLKLFSNLWNYFLIFDLNWRCPPFPLNTDFGLPYHLFRFVSICFVSFRFDLFRFVSICFVSFRFVSFRFDLFRFVPFRFCFVSHFTGTLNWHVGLSV